MLPPLAFAGALKGNSPASLVDKGEPVGADRIILGAPSEGEGLCISCVSFLGCPKLSGDSSRPDSSVLPDTAGDLERGLRALGETSVLLEPTMATRKIRTRKMSRGSLVWVRSRWGGCGCSASRVLYSHGREETKPAAAVTRHDGTDENCCSMNLCHPESRERVDAAQLISIRLAGSLRGASNLPGAFPGELFILLASGAAIFRLADRLHRLCAPQPSTWTLQHPAYERTKSHHSYM
jgi:hypothetical protein